MVGPNLLFLRYIAQVLPSLGETAVTQTTLPGLVAHRFRVRAVDDEATVAALKGDAADGDGDPARGRAPRLATDAPDDIALRAFGATLHLRAPAVQGVLDGVHARDVSAARRSRAAPGPARAARARPVHRAAPVGRRGGPRPRAADAAGELTAAVNRLWPVPSAPVLVRRVLGNRSACWSGPRTGSSPTTSRRCCSASRRARWPRSSGPAPTSACSTRPTGWSAGRPRTFGHVVVDEAQDHSAMELRLLARRSPDRSMTLLGDLAQATATGAQTQLDRRARGARRAARPRRGARARLPRARAGARVREPAAAGRRARGAAEPVRARDRRAADGRRVREPRRDPRAWSRSRSRPSAPRDARSASSRRSRCSTRSASRCAESGDQVHRRPLGRSGSATR